MKKLSVLFIIILSLTLGSMVLSKSTWTDESEDHAPKTVLIAPDKVFVPPGFDNNDHAQLVISGNLPSTCYKVGHVKVRIDLQSKKITIRNETIFYSGCWCLRVLIPFTQTVNLGILSTGDYQVEAESDHVPAPIFKPFSIALSTNSGPDDQLYAVIDDAILDTSHAGPQRELTLKGQLTTDCMSLKKVKVMYRVENVIEVLPIVTLKENMECNPLITPFEAKVTLESPWKGQTLIHVRSLNGSSVNKVYEF